MDNEKVKSILRAAGVPREVFGTTLKKEGMDDVREYIANKVYEQRPLVYIYPSSVRNEKSREKAELCFYLMIKELILSQVNAYACPLVDVHTALFKDTEEAESLQSYLNTQVIGIARFTDNGGRTNQFMTDYEIQYFYSWLCRRYNSETGLILLGNTPLSDSGDWWPSSMLAYIEKRAVSFEIKG